MDTVRYPVVELRQYTRQRARVELRFHDEVRPKDHAHPANRCSKDQVPTVRLQWSGHAHVVVTTLAIGETPGARIRSVCVDKNSMAGEIRGRARYPVRFQIGGRRANEHPHRAEPARREMFTADMAYADPEIEALVHQIDDTICNRDVEAQFRIAQRKARDGGRNALHAHRV